MPMFVVVSSWAAGNFDGRKQRVEWLLTSAILTLTISFSTIYIGVGIFECKR